MSLISKGIILLSLCLFSSVFSLENQIQCDLDNRPSIVDCIQGDIIPVCGYYTENCPLEVCSIQFMKPCSACQFPTILYYTIGECNPWQELSECNNDYVFNPNQPQAYEPVCGVSNNSQVQVQSKTFDNIYESCADKNYHWYYEGACEDKRKYCDTENRPTDCTEAKNKPVCASFALDSWSALTTVSDSCTACQDPAVEYYTEGECGTLSGNVNYCLPNNRPEACTREYNPVCGFYKGESYDYEHKIISNPCTACADSDIVYYTPGPCEFTCDRDPNIFYECIGSFIEPICGTYEENGKTEKVSLKNQCIGCHDVPIQISSYVEGLCPGDVGIRCENDAEGVVQGVVSPVCGISQENCNDDSCRLTFSEPLFACSDPSTILYIPGMCPGDEGISCKPFRLTETDDENEPWWWLEHLYQGVCGYSNKGCEDDSCRQTYIDQREACSNESVIFFTDGPCGGELNEETEFIGEEEFAF